MEEWRLLARAVPMLALTVAATRVLPYRTWRRIGLRLGATRTPGTAVPPGMVVSAIDSASRVVPGGDNCLARALACRALLARAGLASQLVLGVSKRADGSLHSHAWLLHHGSALLGDRGVRGYAPMPDLAGRL